MKRIRKFTIVLSWILITGTITNAHEGPDPIAHWVFNSRTVVGDQCLARLGPDLSLDKNVRLATTESMQSLDLIHEHYVPAMTDWLRSDNTSLPSKQFTVSTCFSIDEAEEDGGIVSVVGDDDAEIAWRIGYNEKTFSFSLNSADGGLVELVGKTPYSKGKLCHVVAIYDGKKMELYVNGKLDASTEQAIGSLIYPKKVRIALGGGAKSGSRSLRGKLMEVCVYGLAAKAAWVQHAYSHISALVNEQPDARPDALVMMVQPYLQYGTQDGMTIMWQTNLTGSSIVHYGETSECSLQFGTVDDVSIHEVRIEDLEPETQYFYRTETKALDGQTVTSRVSTFTTAVNEQTPFAFAVISDTQSNPDVVRQVSKLSWAQRPSFLLHPGDLVSTGTDDSHWTQHFFPGMQELISRVPFYPVLGNHEQNAQNYYDYMSLPDPEYYYEFKYGNAHFFMIDSNRDVSPSSEQYQWLNKKLSGSDSIWKFVSHHHPPYSSDENDYGDLWQTNKSHRGDLRARELSELYEKHNVDIVWNGHIHSYERTWPIKNGKAVADSEGPIYMIVGGGGGGLETPGPTRPFFQNHVRRNHHYVMVHINGEKLEVRSYDIEDRLFDTFVINK